MGLGPAALFSVQATPHAGSPQLELLEVDAAFGRIAATSGAGSTAERGRLLGELLGRATAPEQDFLQRLLVGELCQGALEGVLLEVVARAAGVPAERVRRAAMAAGALPPVARVALVEPEGLSRFLVQLF